MTAVRTIHPGPNAGPTHPALDTHPQPGAGRHAGSTAGGPVAAAVDPATGLHSAIYEGTLHHARARPAHGFSYRVLMAYLDLDELPRALDAHPLWSARRPAPMRFRRADYHGDPAVPLDHAVRTTIAQHLGRRPEGPIRMLANLRTWGWSFNPIAFYFAFAPDGITVEALLAEVTNTPWHERHAYVLPIGHAEQRQAIRFPKALHVSPFMDMDLDHALSFTRPGAPVMTIRMDDWRAGGADDAGDERVFAATLRLERRPLDRRSMGHALRAHPVPAQRVSASIYLEALKLRLKGAPFRRHPGKGAAPNTEGPATTPPSTTRSHQ